MEIATDGSQTDFEMAEERTVSLLGLVLNIYEDYGAAKQEYNTRISVKISVKPTNPNECDPC